MAMESYLERIKNDFPLLSSERAWFPSISGKNRTGRPDILATKITGEGPYLPAGKSWPECKNCSRVLLKKQKGYIRKRYRTHIPVLKNKEFVCKINLSDIPEPLQDELGFRKGLFQMFSCRKCHETETEILDTDDFRAGTLGFLCALVVAENNLDTDTLPSELQSYVEKIDTLNIANFQSNFGKTPHRYVNEWVEKKEMVEAEDVHDDPYQVQLTRKLLSLGEKLGFRQRWGYVKLGGVFRAPAPTCQQCKKSADKKFFHFNLGGRSDGTGFGAVQDAYGEVSYEAFHPTNYFFAEVWFCSRCKIPVVGWHPQTINPGLFVHHITWW